MYEISLQDFGFLACVIDDNINGGGVHPWSGKWVWTGDGCTTQLYWNILKELTFGCQGVLLFYGATHEHIQVYIRAAGSLRIWYIWQLVLEIAIEELNL